MLAIWMLNDEWWCGIEIHNIFLRKLLSIFLCGMHNSIFYFFSLSIHSSFLNYTIFLPQIPVFLQAWLSLFSLDNIIELLAEERKKKREREREKTFPHRLEWMSVIVDESSNPLHPAFIFRALQLHIAICSCPCAPPQAWLTDLRCETVSFAYFLSSFLWGRLWFSCVAILLPCTNFFMLFQYEGCVNQTG